MREHAGPTSVTVADGDGQVVLQPVRLIGPAVLVRTAVLRALAALPDSGADDVLAETWGALPGGDLVAVALGGRATTTPPDVLLDALERSAGAAFHAELDGQVTAVVAAGSVPAVLEVATRVRGVRAGVSDPAPVAELGRALREAGRALDAAERRDRAGCAG